MKRIIFLFTVLASFSFSALRANDIRSDLSIPLLSNQNDVDAALRRAYIPTALDYVLPQAFMYKSNQTYVDWNNGTGFTCPYCNYSYWVGQRCQVMYLVWLGGEPYAMLKFVGTTYSTLWPVNETSPFGAVTDYLIKTI